MRDSPFFSSLQPSDRLRLLVDELRHSGLDLWILAALEDLADEIEIFDPEPLGNSEA
jgi:hypothetical protein